MLDTATKRRIDTARDILVGKVPDPKSQVEQITIALIYKFMNDMDVEAEELGGQRQFFSGDFARYSWAKLMHSGLGGYETLNLYAEAIDKMPENPGIPPLFRDIFKNAYLPYRDPETLKSFLKIIDEFVYDHSERLGDAFEYLLSVLGSQGDAGQFRTPRHIIDFIVEIIDPKKDETILDPACGTAGFLISSYKHILRANMDEQGRSTLTPDEKGRLAANFKGYDISPDMVRLSLVNLYLHGFTDPHVDEYDTLTSEDKWNEFSKVIFANPPFMSPKGGIKPHRRFSVQSNRSEVLFVDYIAEHLTPSGRSGVIVPEGIIFQSQTAYKDLRKMLVEKYLVAVISLPAGIFNPYSGVKTSILILDKSLACQSNTIAFFKVENDGFGLGAQRRPIGKNDIPQVKAELKAYMQAVRSQQPTDEIQPTLGLIVEKEKIVANGHYTLSAERYREGTVNSSTFPMVSLGEICELIRGVTYNKDDEVAEGGHKVLRANNINKDRSALDLTDVKQVSAQLPFQQDKKLRKDDVFICLASGSKDHIGKVALVKEDMDFYFGGFMGVVRCKPDRLQPAYLFHQLRTSRFNNFLREQIVGANINNLGANLLYKFQIPLPPLGLQKEIVTEIEGYQKVIDGAHMVLYNYRPHIPIHPDWLTVKFEEAPFQIIDGDRGTNYPSKEDFSSKGYCVFLNTKNVRPDGFNFDVLDFISKEKDRLLRKGKLQRGDVILTTRGTVGNTAFYDDSVEFENLRINSGMLIFRPESDKLSGAFLFHFFQSQNFKSQRDAIISGAAQPQLPIRSLNEAKIPLPPLEIQQQIVAEIEAEQALVACNRELIERFEKKIQSTIAHVWGEVASSPVEV